MSRKCDGCKSWRRNVGLRTGWSLSEAVAVVLETSQLPRCVTGDVRSSSNFFCRSVEDDGSGPFVTRGCLPPDFSSDLHDFVLRTYFSITYWPFGSSKYTGLFITVPAFGLVWSTSYVSCGSDSWVRVAASTRHIQEVVTKHVLVLCS